MTLQRTLLIHWVRDELHRGKSYDSMRASANLERLSSPCVLLLDEIDPFLVRGFPVLVQALSPKKVLEFRFIVDFSKFENEAWKKGLERAMLFLNEKKLSFSLCELAHPAFFNKPVGPDRYYKKSLLNQGVKLRFIPFDGEYQGRHFPEDYTNEEKLYFEFEDEKLSLYRSSHLESDEFITPEEKKQRFTRGV